MKNRYIKHAHISESKFGQLLKLFSKDLTATQVAKLTGFERKTVNRIFQLLRGRIVDFAAEESYFSSEEIEVDESYFSAKRVRRQRGRGAGGKMNVFANGRAHINGIEHFWGVAKSRMVKVRGIKKEKFNIYLKETEWRFNHRYKNIYKLLFSILRKKSALIYSRTFSKNMKSQDKKNTKQRLRHF